MPAKEDLTQVERDKIEIGPDIDFRKIAERSLEDLSSNEIGMFKWSGVYHQLQKGFFMIRLRLPGGIMTSEQLLRASELADQYGQGQMCITTRMTIQFHWIRLEDIYKIIEGMEEVGVNTRNACGDVTRNVVTCALAGVCPEEITDTVEKVNLIADDPVLLNDYRNFPRKHKISVAGCGRACGQTLMNCQGWHPTEREVEGKKEVGWVFYAGGGLGARPYIGKKIFEWVPSDLVLQVARASAEAFNRHGNRRVRALARLKIVVDKMGPEKYGEVVLSILKEWNIDGIDEIAKAKGGPELGDDFLKGRTVIPQAQKDVSTVRVMVARGELTGDEGRQIASWSRTYGDGTIIFTNRQNFQFRNVPNENVESLLKVLKEETSWHFDGHEHLPDSVACVGTTVCNLAVSDTPNTYEAIVSELGKDKEWWESIGPLKLNMNGCPNSRGQHAISDIGLRGTRKREVNGSDEGFSLYVGGTLGGEGHIAEFVCDLFAQEVVPTLKILLNIYLAEREGGKESFGQWARKVTGEKVREKLIRVKAKDLPLNERNMKLSALFKDALTEER